MYLLNKSSDYFIESASKIGSKIGLSEMIVGLLIVSIGTSLPEFVTSILALFSLRDSSSFIIGNIVGSNIANVCLVFGVIMLYMIKKKLRPSKLDIFVLIILTGLLTGMSFMLHISRISGLIILIIYIIYITFKVNSNNFKEHKSVVKDSYPKLLLFLLGSGIVIYYSAESLIYSVKGIASELGIPLYIISLTTVAVGTSLPELFVTLSALKRGKIDIAYGNVVGSNIANIGLIIGVSSIIKPLYVNWIQFFLSYLALLFATMYLIILSFKKPKRYFGISLLLFYTFYILLLFIR